MGSRGLATTPLIDGRRLTLRAPKKARLSMMEQARPALCAPVFLGRLHPHWAVAALVPFAFQDIAR